MRWLSTIIETGAGVIRERVKAAEQDAKEL
jgi:hypothetical protein